VDRDANSLSTGSAYRFRYGAINSMGNSEYSDSVRIGMGPLPSQPNTPSRYVNGNTQD
jgi:hypothetical protein